MKDGKERWRQIICDLDQLYYASAAPVIVGNHVIVGVSGDDLDIPGYVQSHDPETGEMQWRWYVRAAEERGPGVRDLAQRGDGHEHGGGMTWQPPTYDPELNLIYVTTGNPQPVIAHKNRPGANLFTASIVALNPTPARWSGISRRRRTTRTTGTRRRPRCSSTPSSTASRASCWRRRRATATSSCSIAPTARRCCRPTTCPTNWSKGVDEKGQPIPDPAKDPQIDGALVSPNQGGATNWPPPSFSPRTGLFYVSAAHAYSVWYIYDAGDNPQGWGGTDRGGWSAEHAAGDRLQDRQGPLEPQVGGRRSAPAC